MDGWILEGMCEIVRICEQVKSKSVCRNGLGSVSSDKVFGGASMEK